MNDLDSDGFKTIRTWGDWALKQQATDELFLVLEYVPRSYAIAIYDLDALDWAEHLAFKTWGNASMLADFASAQAYCLGRVAK